MPAAAKSGPLTTWLDLPGYSNYKISSDGQVWSRPRPRARGGILSQSVDAKGYRTVTLCENGKQQTHRVHVLVCTAFHGPRPEGHWACHWDDDKDNNSSSNLRWDTPSENNYDR